MSAFVRALVGAAAIALEALALVRLGADRPLIALLLHVGSAGLLAHSVRASRDARALAIAWFWAALFPIVGVLIAASLTRAARAPQSTLHASWETQRQEAARQALTEKQRAQTIGADVLSLVDALRDRDPALRTSAVDTLRDARTPWAVQLLARERDNDIYEVRFRAVASLGRIGARHLEQIAAARRQLQRGENVADAHAQLAILSLDYAELGVDDARVNRLYVEEAVAHARRALADRDDPALRLVLASACARLDAVAQAAKEYRRVLAADPDDAGALAGMAEMCLVNRDFTALREICERLHRRGRLSASELRELARLWAGAAGAGDESRARVISRQEQEGTQQWKRPTSA